MKKIILFLLILSTAIANAQVGIQYNFHPYTPKAIDTRSPLKDGLTIYTNVAQVKSSVPAGERYLGQTFYVGTSSDWVEYWFYGGLGDGNLVVKSSGGGGVYTAGFGLTLTGSVFKLSGASYGTSDSTKLAGIATGATAYTNASARGAISLTTTGTGAATYNSTTGVLNVPTATGGTYTASGGIALTGSNFALTTGALPNNAQYVINKDGSGNITYVSARQIVTSYARQLVANYATVSGTSGDTVTWLMDFVDAISPFYNKFSAMYVFTGTDKKVNLVNPGTTTGTFYLSNLGSPIYGSDGVTLPTASDKVFTNLRPMFVTDAQNIGTTIWTKTDLIDFMVETANSDGSGASSTEMAIEGLFGGKAYPNVWSSSSGITQTGGVTYPGFHDWQRIDATTIEYRIGGNSTQSEAIGASGVDDHGKGIMMVGNGNRSTTIQFFAPAHNFLTVSEMTIYKNAVFTLMSKLGR